MNPRCKANLVIGEVKFRCNDEEGHVCENGEESRHWAVVRMDNPGEKNKSVSVHLEWD